MYEIEHNTARKKHTKKKTVRHLMEVQQTLNQIFVANRRMSLQIVINLFSGMSYTCVESWLSSVRWFDCCADHMCVRCACVCIDEVYLCNCIQIRLCLCMNVKSVVFSR